MKERRRSQQERQIDRINKYSKLNGKLGRDGSKYRATNGLWMDNKEEPCQQFPLKLDDF